jgi:hypothetical protein
MRAVRSLMDAADDLHDGFTRDGPGMNRACLLAAAVATRLASLASAQGPTAADVLQSATEIAATLDDPGQCNLSLHGAPVLDELTELWLIAYSGAGPACDDTGARLQREGIAANIAFYRRPNAVEIKALLGDMRASVRRGFDCLISFRGEPQFDDESNRWTVRYYTSGHQCTDAAGELERQGRELRVSFQRIR